MKPSPKSGSSHRWLTRWNCGWNVQRIVKGYSTARDAGGCRAGNSGWPISESQMSRQLGCETAPHRELARTIGWLEFFLVEETRQIGRWAAQKLLPSDSPARTVKPGSLCIQVQHHRPETCRRAGITIRRGWDPEHDRDAEVQVGCLNGRKSREAVQMGSSVGSKRVHDASPALPNRFCANEVVP
jgi:hypothetical protein